VGDRSSGDLAHSSYCSANIHLDRFFVVAGFWCGGGGGGGDGGARCLLPQK
jgi:hypothetical protein